MPTAESLLATLINIDSTSGREKDILDYLEQQLIPLGFAIERIPVTAETYCLYATLGQPQVVLQAHADTVEPYLPLKQTATEIWGRGACDTKASVAAMVTAASQAVAAGLTDFGLLFTVEEETTFAGAKAAQLALTDRLPYVIVGEPTNRQPIVAQSGIVVADVIAKGKAAHTSNPSLGINAIDTLIAQGYSRLGQVPLADGSIPTVTMIQGGLADNIVPPEAMLQYSIRTASGDQTDYIALLRQILAPLQVEPGLVIPAVASQVLNELAFLGTGQSVKYATELAFWQNGLVWGPGDIDVAHTDQERIELAELTAGVVGYFEILKALATQR